MTMALPPCQIENFEDDSLRLIYTDYLEGYGHPVRTGQLALNVNG
jgi:uncharacterized protein (TIGR02996 family)